MENKPIVVERLFHVPVNKVWKAITDKDEMKKWYFDLKEFKAEKGFTFQFTGGPPDGIQYIHVCEITEVIPEKKLTYSWRYEGYAGLSFVTFDLSDQGGDTLLRLSHDKTESFPKENKDLARTNFEMGWDGIINSSLKEYLEVA
jgi:uncharacterized protein YndB with AHSA1/START domain